MIPPSGPNGLPPLLKTTIKTVVAIAFLSVLAGQFLSERTLDHKSLSRLAANASRPGQEPAFTGAITKAAGTSLDPCGEGRR